MIVEKMSTPKKGFQIENFLTEGFGLVVVPRTSQTGDHFAKCRLKRVTSFTLSCTLTREGGCKKVTNFTP
jgi:hypothetical protein